MEERNAHIISLEMEHLAVKEVKPCYLRGKKPFLLEGNDLREMPPLAVHTS